MAAAQLTTFQVQPERRRESCDHPMPTKRSELVVLRTFENVIDAEFAKTTLEAADVESFIQTDDTRDMRPHLGTNQVRVVVWAHDADKAFAILGASD